MVYINQERIMYQNFAIEGGKDMNNQQKFAKIVTEVTGTRKRCRQYLETQKDKEQPETRLVLEELDFKRQWDPHFTFCSTDYGMYTQMKWNKKRRIQAIPICFFVTLYELDVKRAFPKQDIQIPCTLRGFWKMEKAVNLLEEFIHFQNKWKRNLFWEAIKLQRRNQKKASQYAKVIDEFTTVNITIGGWKDFVFYQTDLKFCFNKTNVKLDIVPLCKLLTTYYVNVVRKIDWYINQYATKAEEERLQELQKKLADFMEKYFIHAF